MRLEDMLKDISGITNQVVKTNCFEGQNTLLESILLLQSKMNEVIQAINDGFIKGDKGDKGDTGDKGDKGDKGDTGKATESIQDDVISLDTTWSSTKIDSCFNDIKNIQGVKYGNDVGYQVCKGTHNGIVKDLKIYGKSLVSRFSKKHTETNITVLYSGVLSTTGFKVEVGKTYTVLGSVKSPTKNMCDVYYQESNTIIGNFKGVPLVFKAIKNETLQFVSLETGSYVLDDVMILEGDYSKTPPNGYFEGIASVGNGNEIEVLSSDNGNLFDGEFIRGTVNGDNGTLIPQDNIYNVATKNIIKVVPNMMVNYKSIGSRGFRQGKNVSSYYYDKNNVLVAKMLVNTFESITIPNNCYGIRLVFADFELATNQPLNSYNMILNQIGTLDNHNFAKQDKKTIFFKDVDNTWKPLTILRGIDETNCDILDAEKGKLVKKYNQMNINKNLNIILNDATKTNTIAFAVVVNDAKPGSFSVSNNKCICSKFKNITYGIDEVGFSGTSSNVFVFRINKTDLETQDVKGCKKWLETNSFVIVYELNEYKEYEINPIYPNSYENETMILFNTGVIPCKNEFYIDSNLGSLQLETLDRLSRIEDYIYQSNVAILRGDFRTLAELYFPNDFIKEEELTNE